MATQVPQTDVHAFGRALQTYRKLSLRHTDDHNGMQGADDCRVVARKHSANAQD